MNVEARSLCVILKFAEVRCIVHSCCCDTAQITVRPFLVENFLTKLILEIIQPTTEARKIRHVSRMHNWYSNTADRTFCVLK